MTAPTTTTSESGGPARARHTGATSAYLVANGIDRTTALTLRREHEGAIVSRNADGTYRVTRGR